MKYSLEQEKAFMLSYLEGSSSAFAQIYEAYHRPIFKFFLQRTQNTELATDLLQNTFLKFHKIRESYDSRFAVLQWLYTIARSELIDFWRKSQSQRALEKIFSENLENMSQNESAASLKQEWSELLEYYLEGLSDEAKDVAARRLILEEDFEDLVLRSGKKSSALRKIFSRAKKSMKEKVS
jgi:RNA polymerase sigma factor (sigma-70 family)